MFSFILEKVLLLLLLFYFYYRNEIDEQINDFFSSDCEEYSSEKSKLDLINLLPIGIQCVIDVR